MRDCLKIRRVCTPAVAARGLTLLELTVASVILAVLLTTSVQILRVVSTQHRAADRRAVALQTVQAIAEQVGNMPWEKLTTEATREIKVPTALESHLPGAKLTIAIQDEAEPNAKRIAIELSWNSTSGRPTAPVRLITWAFPDQTETKPAE